MMYYSHKLSCQLLLSPLSQVCSMSIGGPHQCLDKWTADRESSHDWLGQSPGCFKLFYMEFLPLHGYSVTIQFTQCHYNAILVNITQPLNKDLNSAILTCMVCWTWQGEGEWIDVIYKAVNSIVWNFTYIFRARNHWYYYCGTVVCWWCMLPLVFATSNYWLLIIRVAIYSCKWYFIESCGHSNTWLQGTSIHVCNKWNENYKTYNHNWTTSIGV